MNKETGGKKMKKTLYTRVLTALLVLLMIMSMAACAQNTEQPAQVETEKEQTETPAVEPAAENTDISFPLAEEVSFDIMVKYDGDLEAELAKCAWWQRLYEETNVKVNFITMPSENTMGVLNAMFAAEEEGDAILGGSIINESNLSLMAANGLLLPMNAYIDDPEIMPNFNERVLAESPSTKGLITAPDGNIYSLPKYKAIEGNYLESPIWINKVWLDKAGLAVPTTIEELEAALIAFRDGDMNDNGDTTDEIPYLVRSADSAKHFEAILGLWGIATKDNANDNYVYVKDGKVIFAPTSEAYKDAMITLNRWYEEGLIWSEAFTANDETLTAKFTSETPLFGMITTGNLPAAIIDQYVVIEPVAVDGYEANWFTHPGILGTKGMFSLTRSCENPEILMKWIDLFYTFDNTVAINYGEEADGRWSLSNGKLFIESLGQEDKDRRAAEAPEFNSLILNPPSAFTSDDYANRIELSEGDLVKQQNYEIYKNVMTDEIWPRPYISEEDVTRLSELRTDIFNTVSLKKAEWITGESDVETDWDAYVSSLDKMGVAEFVDILQRNYDNFMAGQN